MAEMSDRCCDIAFVTVNYNTRALVEEMLNFFSGADLPFSHALVVVDNGSCDGSHELLSQQAGTTIYIPAGENLGYGRAINRGIRAVESRYVCVLNTDVILSAEGLVTLWDFMEKTPQAGIASPRIANRDGSTQGFIFYKSPLSMVFNFINRIRTSLLKARLARSTAPMRVQGVLGAFFLIRRSLVPDAGLFDEDFFFYYEDTDLAHRLHEAGALCFALPLCSVIHLGGSSTSIEGARMFFKSKGIYLRKHYGEGFASFIKRIDQFRLRAKHLKYSLLALFLPSRRISEKKAFYAAMRHASDY
jgi:N-acetylglucosaminyl-diphospho-decaprenol L-rhamnosyltransferase